MKKFILATIVGVILLSNAAFATTKITHVNQDKSHTVSSLSQIRLQSNDPGGW